MYLNDKSLEIQKEGAWGRYTSAGKQDNSRLGWRSTYVGWACVDKLTLKSGMLVWLHRDCLGRMKGDGDLEMAFSFTFRAALPNIPKGVGSIIHEFYFKIHWHQLQGIWGHTVWGWEVVWPYPGPLQPQTQPCWPAGAGERMPGRAFLLSAHSQDGNAAWQVWSCVQKEIDKLC